MTDPARRPEPVRNAAAAAAAVTTVVGLVLTVLVVGHVLTPDDSAILGPALAAAIPTVVGAASTVVAALRARLKVTPLSDPRNAAGQALTARPPIPQRPGVADHAAPEEAPTEAMRQAHLNETVDYPESPPGR